MKDIKSAGKIFAAYLVFLFSLQTSSGLAQVEKPKVVPELWHEIRDYGTAQVLARLNVTWRPEAKLATTQRVAQREAIADAQDRVLAELAGTDHRVISFSRSSPFLALECRTRRVGNTRHLPSRSNRHKSS